MLFKSKLYAPPAIAMSIYPCLIFKNASPIALFPDAQAVATLY
jgi:hypothetical protein